MFGRFGFRGNTAAYYDVRNSLIHHVLRRRVGIPLSLAVVVVEIGRRHGVELAIIGLPGHVMLGSLEREVYFDPFAGGRELDRSQVEAMVTAASGGQETRAAHFRPMSPAAVVTRTLENLRGALLRRGDLSRLVDVLELRAALPLGPAEYTVEYARGLANVGRFDMAADVRDALARRQPERATHHTEAAERLRARRN